jgi:putative N-acetylmannosamine-6-phosphate epimerase
MIDQLVELEIDYIHVSLYNILESTPADPKEEKTVATLILDYVNERIPVVAAGQIKTPEQAAKAIDLGLSLVAVGQGIVISINSQFHSKVNKIHAGRNPFL